MKEYRAYIEGVRSGKIIASQYIKQQVERLEEFKKRPDMYFDEEEVQRCFDFISYMKEWSGAAAGKSGALLPFQKWIVGSVIGIKWRDTKTRVCKDMFMLVARKNAKTSLIAKLSAYLMVADNEANPFIGCVASSRDQARILFEAAQKYIKTIDPKGEALKLYRNYIKFPSNDGEFHVFSSDASNMDGYGFSAAICDETHSYKDNKLISVLRSSMGARRQPLLIQISTCGFLLDGYPCFETYKVAIEVLAGIKEDPTFFPFLYVFDNPEEELENEEYWIKCNPAIDVVVSRQYLREQMTLMKNDSTQIVPVKTKNFNIWCQSAQVWIRQEDVAACMKKRFTLEDFRGRTCYIGVDLASVSDLTALSVMVPVEDEFYFFNYAFIPRDTFINSPNHELYQAFVEETDENGGLIITEGNITFYQLITNKIVEVSQIMSIQGIYYDPYNSGQWAIQCTELGFNMQQFRQGLLNFNNPTKEMEKLVLSRKAFFNRSRMVAWEFNNSVLMTDHNQNVKVTKTTGNNKVDNVIASIESLGGYLENPSDGSFEIFVI